LPAFLGWLNGFRLDKNRSKEATHVRRNRSYRSPPRLVLRRPVGLDQLWSQLTDAQRQQTLATLSGIVARQLVAPLVEEEVSNERS